MYIYLYCIDRLVVQIVILINRLLPLYVSILHKETDY